MMKKNIFLLVFLLFSANLFSQEKAATYTSADTAKVNKLLKESIDKFSEAPDKAIAIAEEAKKLAESVGFDEGVANALKNIGIAYYNQANDVDALDYWKQSLTIFQKIKDEVGEASILNNIGAIYFYQKDLTNALEYYLKSLKLAEKTKNKLRILTALNNIGGIYFEKPATHDKALVYFLKALPLSVELGDKKAIGTTAVNLGEIYYVRNQDSLALHYYFKSVDAFNNSEGSPYPYNAIGKLYNRKGSFNLAITYHSKALAIAEKLNGNLDIVQSLMGLAKTNISKGDVKTGLNYLKRAEAIAFKHGFPAELKNAYESFSIAYNQLNDYKNAFIYQTKFSNIKDTLYNNETDRKLGSLQFDFDIKKKEGEISLLTKDKELQDADIKRQKLAKFAFLVGLILVLIIAIITYRNYLKKVKTNELLDQQKDQIEDLLHNILPEEIATELKLEGKAKPRFYEEVSVLFTDFKGFSALADKLSPQELVEELNTYFVAFDDIVGSYGLEKIKTIGDSYMCAGGIPSPHENHTFDMVKASLDIQKYIHERNIVRKNKGLPDWDIRIGIHVGSLVAGVVGKKKYAYDIWGTTVNIASRMESNGEPGLVNISQATYDIIKDKYKCTHRGKISAKNIGEIDMYFINEEILN